MKLLAIMLALSCSSERRAAAQLDARASAQLEALANIERASDVVVQSHAESSTGVVTVVVDSWDEVFDGGVVHHPRTRIRTAPTRSTVDTTTEAKATEHEVEVLHVDAGTVVVASASTSSTVKPSAGCAFGAGLLVPCALAVGIAAIALYRRFRP